MHSRITHVLFFSLSILFLAGCGDRSKPTPAGLSFDSTLSIHLRAIRNSDLASLEPTVADSVILISPMGEKMHSKKSFLKLHENWFKLKNWEWEGTFVRKMSTDSMGYALIRYQYTMKDSTGVITYQTNNYLALIFKKFQHSWQLVHDQNTNIPK